MRLAEEVATSFLNKRIIIFIARLLLCHHIGILLDIVGVWCVRLMSINLIVIIAVERIWRAKSIKARCLLGLPANLHERIIIFIACLLLCHHVGILLDIVGVWCVRLMSINLIVIIAVE